MTITTILPITRLEDFPPRYNPRYCVVCQKLIPIEVKEGGVLNPHHNYNRLIYDNESCRKLNKSYNISSANKNKGKYARVIEKEDVSPMEVWLSKKLGSEYPKRLHRIKGVTCFL